MGTKRINKALALVRFIERQPAVLTMAEACAVVGIDRPGSYYYLINTGVLQFAPKLVKTGGKPALTIKLGPNGRAKMEWHGLAGAMAPIL